MTTTTMDEVLPLINSIFVGSFNMNNEDLSYNDAARWLQEAKHADLVVLAMQECGSCRLDGSMPLPENQQQQESWCRKPQLDRSDTVLHSIQDALNDGYKIVADVAMGESATGRKIAIDGEPDTEWYGYIRMIVLARTELADKLSPQCRTLVCPVGSKSSVDSLTSQSPDYPVDASPDKGAVCVALGSDLLLVNVHLAGTNQYNVNEEHFDEIRKHQLTLIHEMCQPYGHCIVAGDFNFRCEIHPNEKSRGGLDFQAVHDIVKSADCEAIGNLYRKHDRLIQLINSNGDTVIPLLLKDTSDSFCYGFKDNEYVMPTFTFTRDLKREEKSGKNCRSYSDKRTPSWTDRVLFSNSLRDKQGFYIISVKTHPDIVVSDHIPVHCLFSRSRSTSNQLD